MSEIVMLLVHRHNLLLPLETGEEIGFVEGVPTGTVGRCGGRGGAERASGGCEHPALGMELLLLLEVRATSQTGIEELGIPFIVLG